MYIFQTFLTVNRESSGVPTTSVSLIGNAVMGKSIVLEVVMKNIVVRTVLPRMTRVQEELLPSPRRRRQRPYPSISLEHIDGSS